MIVAASFTPSFQERYPFFHPAAGHSLWPYMYAWWVLYWLQFCALEFFFRGFLLHGLAPRLGWAAIFAMALPYNMLHYGKPMPEALAAIVGGIALGTLEPEDEVDLVGGVVAHLDRAHDGHLRLMSTWAVFSDPNARAAETATMYHIIADYAQPRMLESS